MDSLYTAVVHSEHRALWKPIDLNQRVRESLSPRCSKLPVSLSILQFMRENCQDGALKKNGISVNMFCCWNKTQGMFEKRSFHLLASLWESHITAHSSQAVKERFVLLVIQLILNARIQEEIYEIKAFGKHAS